jgi:hypothetical protein
MSNAAFRRAYAAIIERAGQRAEQVVRASALGLGASIVRRSPVDTGRFKNNWQYGAGAINTDTSAPPDSSGAGSITRIQQGLNGWKPGQTIYITQSLPYAYRLEHGWSQQAPSGMVRLAVLEFESQVRKAAADLR